MPAGRPGVDVTQRQQQLLEALWQSARPAPVEVLSYLMKASRAIVSEHARTLAERGYLKQPARDAEAWWDYTEKGVQYMQLRYLPSLSAPVRRADDSCFFEDSPPQKQELLPHSSRRSARALARSTRRVARPSLRGPPAKNGRLPLETPAMRQRTPLEARGPAEDENAAGKARELLDMQGVAATLGIDRRTVYQRLMAGRLPAPDRPGPPRRWLRSSVVRLQAAEIADLFLDGKAFAQVLGISRHTLARRLKRGLIPPPDRRLGEHGGDHWRRSTIQRLKAAIASEATRSLDSQEFAAALGLKPRILAEHVKGGWIPRPDQPGRGGLPHRWRRSTLATFQAAEDADALIDANAFARLLDISRNTLTRRLKAGLIPPPDRGASHNGPDRWRRSTVVRVQDARLAQRRRRLRSI